MFYYITLYGDVCTRFNFIIKSYSHYKHYILTKSNGPLTPVGQVHVNDYVYKLYLVYIIV